MKKAIVGSMLLSVLFTFSALQARTGPDLVVDQQQLEESARFEWLYVYDTDCAYLEGCLGGTEWRYLLRFDTQTANIGDMDVALGNPLELPGDFVFDPCHNHYHFGSYATYQIYDFFGEPVGEGSKTGFCLLDSVRYIDEPGTPESPVYNCGNQGVQRGWSDIYDSFLDCQWVDVTDLPDGVYQLEVFVNPEQRITEADYTNNAATHIFQVGTGLSDVPDGKVLANGEKMTARVNPDRSSVDITWDTTFCGAPNYNVLWGRLPGLSNYTVEGHICNIGVTGAETLSMPDPDPDDMIWFVIGARQGAAEGGYGWDWEGNRRPITSIPECFVQSSFPMVGCPAEFPE